MVPTESQMTSTDGSTIQAMSSFTFTAVLKGGAGVGVNALQPTTRALNGSQRRSISLVASRQQTRAGFYANSASAARTETLRIAGYDDDFVMASARRA